MRFSINHISNDPFLADKGGCKWRCVLYIKSISGQSKKVNAEEREYREKGKGKISHTSRVCHEVDVGQVWHAQNTRYTHTMEQATC